MRVMLDDYQNATSEHCGSGSMRDLLQHYCQLSLPESVVFGLGAGLDTLYFDEPNQRPAIMLLGRGVTMEQDLATTLGIDYREQVELSDELAWQQVRQEIIEGRPTMLAGDIYYLDYRKFKVHFPGHRFVLVGFDDEKQCVYIGDRTDVEAQACSLAAVKLSRNSPVGMSSHNLWGKFNSGAVSNSLEEACERSLRITAQRMVGDDRSQLDLLGGMRGSGGGFLASGLAGLTLFQQHIAGWDDRDNDASLAAYLVNTIVNFGTGGGLFRNLFAQYLVWAGDLRPDLIKAKDIDLAQSSADSWNLIATLASKGQHVDWDSVDRQLEAVLQAETQLFEQLAVRL
mgnify:CR=1 FL=1